MTARDRLVIVVVLLAAALAGFWFLALAPKRKEAADLQTPRSPAQHASSSTSAQRARAEARQAKAPLQRRLRRRRRLGKAVPKSDALPSLVYQLQSVAHSARIDFTSLKVSGGGGQGPTPARRGAGGARCDRRRAPRPARSSARSSSARARRPARAPRAPATTPPAPATQAAAATLPPGRDRRLRRLPDDALHLRLQRHLLRHGALLRRRPELRARQRQATSTSAAACSASTASPRGRPRRLPHVKANVVATAYLRTPADDSTSTAATAPRDRRRRRLDGLGLERRRRGRPGADRLGGDPMSAIRGVLRDLVERKLWPVAVLLLAAAVAVPLYLGRASADDAPLPATSLQADAGKVSKAAVRVDDARRPTTTSRRRAQPLQAAARPQEGRRARRCRRPRHRRPTSRPSRARAARAAPTAPSRRSAAGRRRRRRRRQAQDRRRATRSTSTTCRCASAAPRPRS